MRVLALVFPRLGIQLARANHPEPAGRPFALLSGEGDAAMLSTVSVEATADGVEPGMTALQARQRCPGITLEADNARECIERLESITSILQTRATNSVAIVSRNAVAVSIDGTERQFGDESAAAHAILGVARSWSGLDVRAAVASTVDEAVCAASKARRFPVMCPDSGIEQVTLPRYEPLSVSFDWEGPASATVASARLNRMLGSLQQLMSGYGASYRRITVEAEHGPYRWAFGIRPSQPIHTSAEVAELLRGKLDDGRLEGLTSLRITLEGAGPAVLVAPWRAPTATLHQLAGPAVPLQHRLLRAS
jgi:stage V sporulation protein SpoVS